MADEDRAQEVELREWERNNSRVPGQVRFKPDESGYGPEFCQVETCGMELPVQRREWGFTICFDCKRLAEERAGRLR